MQSAIRKRRRFYTGTKGGVGYNAKNNPLLDKAEINKFEWLSNFYPAPFVIDGVSYPTSEHYFQSKRFCRGSISESDELKSMRAEFASIIASAPSPTMAFKLNNYVNGIVKC